MKKERGKYNSLFREILKSGCWYFKLKLRRTQLVLQSGCFLDSSSALVSVSQNSLCPSPAGAAHW